jgi:hypothetical protein
MHLWAAPLKSKKMNVRARFFYKHATPNGVWGQPKPGVFFLYGLCRLQGAWARVASGVVELGAAENRGHGYAAHR